LDLSVTARMGVKGRVLMNHQRRISVGGLQLHQDHQKKRTRIQNMLITARKMRMEGKKLMNCQRQISVGSIQTNHPAQEEAPMQKLIKLSLQKVLAARSKRKIARKGLPLVNESKLDATISTTF